jgi:aerobic-type carbon monoxide dehydrogenase small subunit (CoxS/CutS family)
MPRQPEPESERPDRSPENSGRLSRRYFLTSAGVSAAGAALLDGCAAQLAESKAKPKTTARSGAVAEAPPQPKVVGPGPVQLTLSINGEPRQVQAEPRTTLADLLRDELDLTGTKIVCDRGACSACTVWLDGATVCSCMTLAIDAVGRQVRTIEGLARGEQLHPVQEAFVEHDALQCGFCTPGMVMSCAALLERNQSPSPDEVKQAVRGNLCRCGTYPKVFDATLAAAKQMQGQPREAASRKGA